MNYYQLYKAPNSEYVYFFDEWVNRRMLKEWEYLYGKKLPSLEFEKNINNCIWIGFTSKQNYAIIKNENPFRTMCYLVHILPMKIC